MVPPSPKNNDDKSPINIKDLQRQLLETQGLLDLIMENNPFSIFWKDCDLKYRGCNERFVKMAGFSCVEDVVGKTDFDMPWGVDNEIGAEACRSSDARIISSGLEEMHIIEKIKQQNGPELWTDTSKVPIRDQQGQVTGVLCVLEDITSRKHIEQALEKANTELKTLSRIDSLTKISNRRYFDEQFTKEWERAKRNNNEIALILFDVDHFKQFNDNYGHPAGDSCLTLVAEAAKNNLKRPTDMIARYGGEEFIILLPGSDLQGALILAEKIRVSIESLKCNVDENTAAVTVSLGVASDFPSHQGSLTKLISAADKALYQAKKLGRNRVEKFN